MSDDFLVNPDSLTKDAAKWTDWSADLKAIGESIPLLGTGLDPLAFSILPNAQQVASAYGKVTRALKTSIDTGVEQFDGFSLKLSDSAKAYSEAEKLNIDDIAKVVAGLED